MPNRWDKLRERLGLIFGSIVGLIVALAFLAMMASGVYPWIADNVLPVNMENLMTFVGHLVAIIILSIAGLLFCLVVISSYESHRHDAESAGHAKNHAVLFGTSIIAVLSLLYVSVKRETWEPNQFEPELNFTQETLFKTEKVKCRWHEYDVLDGEKLYGWCTETKDGKWYLFVDPYYVD